MTVFVDVPGAAIWTATSGEGLPVLLSSGGPGCCDYLEPVAPLFRGAQVTRWEQRGCGRSSGGPSYMIEHCLDDMEAIRRSRGVERWVVAGHSWGADLSVLYALQFPERVIGLVCLSGGRVHNDRDWHAAYSAGRDAGREHELDYAFPPNMRVNADLNADWKRWIKRPGLLKELATLECPALFVYGGEDIRPSWPVEQVAALLPDARFELIPEAGHNLWLTHAEQLADVVGRFATAAATVRQVSVRRRRST